MKTGMSIDSCMVHQVLARAMAWPHGIMQCSMLQVRCEPIAIMHKEAELEDLAVVCGLGQ